jgi:hypothetical protein
MKEAENFPQAAKTTLYGCDKEQISMQKIYRVK